MLGGGNAASPLKNLAGKRSAQDARQKSFSWRKQGKSYLSRRKAGSLRAVMGPAYVVRLQKGKFKLRRIFSKYRHRLV